MKQVKDRIKAYKDKKGIIHINGIISFPDLTGTTSSFTSIACKGAKKGDIIKLEIGGQ